MNVHSPIFHRQLKEKNRPITLIVWRVEIGEGVKICQKRVLKKIKILFLF